MTTACQKNRCASLEMMPINIFAHIIIPQLNKMTGDTEILNEADIPVII